MQVDPSSENLILGRPCSIPPTNVPEYPGIRSASAEAWLAAGIAMAPPPGGRVLVGLNRHLRHWQPAPPAATGVAPSPPGRPADDGGGPAGLAAAAAEFAATGVAFVRQLLPPRRLDEVRAAMEHYIEHVVPGQASDRLRLYASSSSRRIGVGSSSSGGGSDGGGHVNANANNSDNGDLKYISFTAFARHMTAERYAVLRELPHEPAIARLARRCLGLRPDAPLQYAAKWLNKPPRPGDADSDDLDGGLNGGTPPHQDGWYFSAAGGATAAPAGSGPPPLCSVWIALDPASAANGGLCYARPPAGPRALWPHVGGGPAGFSQRIAAPGARGEAPPAVPVLEPGVRSHLWLPCPVCAAPIFTCWCMECLRVDGLSASTVGWAALCSLLS